MRRAYYQPHCVGTAVRRRHHRLQQEDYSDAESFSLWRKFGAIGKVHNTVKYIMRSDQRRQLFLSLQKQRKSGEGDGDELFEQVERLLMKDGGVRWNSTYYILYRAFELREYIDKFQQLSAVD